LVVELLVKVGVEVEQIWNAAFQCSATLSREGIDTGIGRRPIQLVESSTAGVYINHWLRIANRIATTNALNAVIVTASANFRLFNVILFHDVKAADNVGDGPVVVGGKHHRQTTVVFTFRMGC